MQVKEVTRINLDNIPGFDPNRLAVDVTKSKIIKTEGDWIYVRINKPEDNYIAYAVCDKDKEIVSYVSLRQYELNGVKWKIIMVKTKLAYRGRGLAIKLYEIAIDDLGIIYSDYEQAIGSTAIWMKLLQMNYPISMFDTVNDKEIPYDKDRLHENGILLVARKKNSIKQIDEVESIHDYGDSHDEYYQSIQRVFDKTKYEDWGKYQKFDIRYREETLSSLVVAYDMTRDKSDQVVAVVKLQDLDIHGEYMKAISGVDVRAEYRKSGIASYIYDLVIRKYSLISDSQQTPAGQRLWTSLFKSGKYKMFAYDLRNRRILGPIKMIDNVMKYEKNGHIRPLYNRIDDFEEEQARILAEPKY